MLLALAGMALGPAGAALEERLVVRYVAGDFYVVGPDLAAGQVRERTGLATAPLGWFEFTAIDSDAVLTIDDEAPSAVVPVSVSHGGRNERFCVADDGSVSIGNLTPGERVSVWIEAPTWSYGGCGPFGGGTVGVATVQR